jgi:hypothetical protein
VDATKKLGKATAGGQARLQIVLLLGAVLGLDAADKATISAISVNLKKAFNIGNAEIGMLVATASFVGAICALPVGALGDDYVLVCNQLIVDAVRRVVAIIPNVT